MEIAESQSREENFIQKLTRIVLDNLTNEQFSVEELAVIYGISRSQLHKKVKKATRKSVSQFIREIRLEEAMKMLRQDAATVSEIAYRVGFSSPTYFNTCFKEFYGYPPGEVKFRNSVVDDGNDIPASDQEDTGHSQKETSSTKNRTTKELVLFASFGIILLAFFAYYFNVDPKDNDSTAHSKQATAVEKSIAVLPFEDVSSKTDQEAFTNAMVVEISNQLVKIKDLQVLSRSSTQIYRGSKKSTKEIASELGSANILMGSIQKEGENVRITVQLVDGGSDKFLWSETYDGKLDSIFGMQRSIAQHVADELRVQINPNVKKRISKAPTENMQAYSMYLDVLGSFGDSDKNIPMLEEAILLDQGFADAYVRLAIEKMHQLSISDLSEQKYKDRIVEIKNLLKKALSLDSENVGAHEILGSASVIYDWDFKKADLYFQRAQELKPAAVDDTYPLYLIASGKPEDALQYNSFRVIPANPNNWGVWLVQALCHTYLNDLEMASEAIEMAKKIGDQRVLKHSGLAWILCLQEEYNEVLAYWELLTEEDYKPQRHLAMAAIAFAKTGQVEPCETIMNQLKKQSDNSPVGSPAYYTALIYGQIKERDLAFKWLEIAYQKHESDMRWLKAERLFEPLHGDQRWPEMLEKVGFNK